MDSECQIRSTSAAPVSIAEAKQLFSSWRKAPALILAVSGGPDSVALLWLMARWQRAVRTGPKLIAVTIDHALRPQSAAEARAVKKLAAGLGIDHRTLRWRGPKPSSGLQAAARGARYSLLADAARKAGATHIVTAHTSDDQAETILMRLGRGSGITGLAGMAREAFIDARMMAPPMQSAAARKETKRGQARDVILARPLLDLPKARLLATLSAHKMAYADDASNRDPRFTRVRFRTLMPALAEEGIDARALGRLARRAARAEAALAMTALGAARVLVRFEAIKGNKEGRLVCELKDFAALPDEIRLRLLGHMISRKSHEGAVELGKLEALLEALNLALEGVAAGPLAAKPVRFKRTLAGAAVLLTATELAVERAPGRAARSHR